MKIYRSGVRYIREYANGDSYPATRDEWRAHVLDDDPPPYRVDWSAVAAWLLAIGAWGYIFASVVSDGL